MSSGLSLLSAIRRCGRWRPSPRCGIAYSAIAVLLAVLVAVSARPAAAQQGVRGEASVTTTDGYGRLLIRLAIPIESQVRMSGGILVIQFKQPVDVPLDRITAGATEYIGAARRDPDGRALRFALARKVKISTMVAAERLYVDLLPESWTAEPPSLPREVVEELARRTNEAERRARQQVQLEAQRRVPAVRVRVANQPTFTRYVFELPELTGVSTDNGKDRLTLSFAGPLRFDLAEAKLSLPPTVKAIDADTDRDTASVKFAFAGQVDLRTFREDTNFVVDVSPIDAARAAKSGPLAGLDPPDTVPAAPAVPAVKAAEPAAPAEPPAPAAEPTGERAEGPDVVPPAAPPAVAEKEPPAPAPAATPSRKPRRDPNRAATAELRRQGDNLRLFFPFAAPTPAAVFMRADTLWLVFDTTAKLDIGALANDPSRTIQSAVLTKEDGAQVVRLKLERPRLVSVSPEENGWAVAVGEAVHEQTKPLGIARNIVGPSRASVTIPFDNPRAQHRLSDPDIGDTLLVVTALGPARGLIKTQDFVEFRALAAAHGIAVQPFADDIKAELSADKVLLGRPSGLTLSELEQATKRADRARAVTFDSKLWSIDREANFSERQYHLVREAADAPFTKRSSHRLDLARFYFAREMFAEAKAVLDVAIHDDRPTAEDPSALVLRAIANIMLGRVDAGLKDLTNPVVGNHNDAQLWRGLAHARLGRWAEARDAFRHVEAALSALPIELQRIALKEALRASIEVGDYTGAVDRFNDFEVVGVSRELEPPVTLLSGRLAEGLGRKDDALSAYRSAAASANRPASAQARLRETALRYALGEIKKTDVINELEILTTAWRGDETEAEALQTLARLYTEENRYRDAFHVMRVALTAHPSSTLTRNIHDEAAKTFDSLFLAGKGDTLPAIDALSLFYDFRELTPIGRRGDEMIRRLADRLVAVDLLDQAAELLQHQIDNRLQGAARAQVATRLAVIYLINHKPDKAQATLRATRTAELSDEVRVPRLLLEARALSDLGRHDFALEVIAGIDGRESLRLRSDIHWAARRWQKSAEHIELLHGDRWKSFEPLGDAERADILRAGVGYALAEDKIGLGRLRDKYAAKMAGGPDRRAFEVITGGFGGNSAEFRAAARVIAVTDTLQGFLRDLRARYPEMHNVLPGTPGQAKPNAPAAAKPDPSSTGTILKPAPRRLSAR
jgi:tetratricopeptide (TPR) repeat protein